MQHGINHSGPERVKMYLLLVSKDALGDKICWLWINDQLYGKYSTFSVLQHSLQNAINNKTKSYFSCMIISMQSSKIRSQAKKLQLTFRAHHVRNLWLQ